MITRLLALIILPLMAYWIVRSAARRFQLNTRQTRLLFGLVLVLMVIAILVILGRLPVHFIIAPLGVAATFLLRMLPMLLRLLPFWQMIKSRVSSARPCSDNQTSTIRTRYLEMVLQHNTGDMDGEVLFGEFAGANLSNLSLDQLLSLLREIGDDADSTQVLEAYLDRTQSGWREQTGRASSANESDEGAPMTRTLALEILGLEEGVDREAIIKAHRNLMQKLHPDRGGSDYLAKKINLAKDYLLNDLQDS